ncbi:MAG: ABC transporter permease [Fusobacteriota bacterium]
MIKYILKRIGMGFLTLLIITTITFFLLHALPGDPFASEKAIPPKIKARLMAEYHLDKPVVIQYGYYLGNLVRGNFGMSMKIRGRKVLDIVKSKFPYSLDVGLRAIFFGFFVGVSLGIIAALNRGQTWDSVAMLVAILGVSVPSFILAGGMQWFVLLIGKTLNITFLPIAGYNGFKHTIMPTLALGLMPVAIMARMMRASMIEVLGSDYIRTARAKGVSPFKVTVKHCIRNAIMPVIVYLGPLTAAITTGSFVIEQVFAIPGLGRYYVQSLYNRDYTMVLGITIFYAALLIIMILLVDVLHGLIDPRIRVGKGGEE